MFNLGLLLAKQGRTAEAEEWYRKASDAGDTDAISNLGSLFARQGKDAEAEEWYRKGAATGNPAAMSHLSPAITFAPSACAAFPLSDVTKRSSGSAAPWPPPAVP
jgi:TPR repeat protein